MDIEQLVEAVTKEIMRRLEQPDNNNVCCIGCDPKELFSPCAVPVNDVSASSYVVLKKEEYQKLLSGKCNESESEIIASACPSGNFCDLSSKKLLHERDVRESGATCGDTIQVGKSTIITALASDYAKANNITIKKG